MICPQCAFENIQGVDQCENCGADLRAADVPAPSTDFEASLVSQALAGLQPPSPITIAPDATAAEAVRLMNEHHTGCLIVEDGGGIRGILSERDLLLKVDSANLDELTVAGLMTADPVVLRPDDTIAVAIHKMAVGGFRHIPLVVDWRATGLVGAQDVFGYIVKALR